MKFLKKNLSNILILIAIALLFIPQTSMPIKVFLQRTFAGSPSIIKTENQQVLTDYQWQLQDLQGNKINLSQSQNKVLIINIWATWCPPCVAEMPSFQALYNDYQNKVDFYFISSEKTETLNRFLEKYQYTLPVQQPLENEPDVLNSKVLPTTFVIDKTGKIVVNKSGAANWNSTKFRQQLDGLL